MPVKDPSPGLSELLPLGQASSTQTYVSSRLSEHKKLAPDKIYEGLLLFLIEEDIVWQQSPYNPAAKK